MVILVTGGHGYIGKQIVADLSKNHEIIAPTHAEVDLVDRNAVKSLPSADLVIHAASVGGRRTQEDSADVLYQNLRMWYNVADLCKRTIVFSSGAWHNPTYYGLSKRAIEETQRSSGRIACLRIYNCFHHTEKEDRFVRANITRYIRQEPMIVHRNKFMDFFYMDDLVMLVRDLVNNFRPKLYECCYDTAPTLCRLASKINLLGGHEVPIQVQHDDRWDDPYVGMPCEADISTKFSGLRKGLKLTYQQLLEEMKNG